MISREVKILYEDKISIYFKKINPDLLSPKICFERIKAIAVWRLNKAIHNQFDSVTLIDKCDYNNMEQISKNIFTWRNNDFLKRRSLKNCVWIDVMQKHLNGDCLERFKIQTDLNEVKAFLELIFKGFQNSGEYYDFGTLVGNTLRDAESYLNIFEILQDQRKILSEKLQDYEILFNTRLLAKRQTRQQLILWDIEEIMLNAQTWDPIQMRFEINWYRCKREQNLLKNNLKENDVQKQIADYKFKILTEEMSGDNIRDTYYNLAEQHKYYIDELQKRYDVEHDGIVNQINYNRLQISKLIEKRKLLNEQIEQFREEIKRRLEKEEFERQEQELKRLEDGDLFNIEKNKILKTKKVAYKT